VTGRLYFSLWVPPREVVCTPYHPIPTDICSKSKGEEADKEVKKIPDASPQTALSNDALIVNWMNLVSSLLQ
jgi:hypothetical protein